MENEENLDNYGLPYEDRGVNVENPEPVFIETSELEQAVERVIHEINGQRESIQSVTTLSDSDLYSNMTASNAVNEAIRTLNNMVNTTVSDQIEALVIGNTIDPVSAENISDIVDTVFESIAVDTPVSNTEEDTSEEDVVSVEIPEVEEVQETPEIPSIPSNINILGVRDTTSRFSSAEWFQQIQRERVILAGVGGIGSYVAFLLARMRIQHLTVYDDDIVDAVNMSGQFFGMNDIGKSKVSSLGSALTNYSNFYSYAGLKKKYVAEGCAVENVMICGFDNMIARKIYFESWLRHVNSLNDDQKNDCLFIDGRLAAEEYQVYCIKGSDTYSIDKYRTECLFTDAEADATLCSYKQTSFMANQIASTIVNLFVNFVANKCEPIIDRYLPYYTEFNAETMFYKTIL